MSAQVTCSCGDRHYCDTVNRCAHSACSQNYIDTGETACIAREDSPLATLARLAYTYILTTHKSTRATARNLTIECLAALALADGEATATVDAMLAVREIESEKQIDLADYIAGSQP